ncbi:MFS transporter, partial [Streptomyces hydrogenans]
LQGAACLTKLTWEADSAYHLMWPAFIALGLGVGMVMASSSDAIVGNAPVEDAGVAGGLQATALQIGGALGTSVLVSLIAGRVGASLAGELTSAGVPAPAAAGLLEAKDAVAMGVAPVSADLPAQLKVSIVEGSHNAFMNGVHAAVLTAGVLCVAGAVLAVVGVRRVAGHVHH